MSASEWRRRRPAPALRPLIDSYVGYRMDALAAGVHRGLPSRHLTVTPLGSRALLGMPAGELWDTSVEAADVLGPAAVEVWERLHHAGGWAERLAACDEVFGRLVARTAAPAPAPEPHLNRDFVALAGCPPGEWLAAELPSVQDAGGPEPTGSII